MDEDPNTRALVLPLSAKGVAGVDRADLNLRNTDESASTKIFRGPSMDEYASMCLRVVEFDATHSLSGPY